ncbi:MAG: AAA family ATPase [Bacteroidetes bacterium]|nr:AAA family ATPase [Bacteroidota bacterium]
MILKKISLTNFRGVNGTVDANVNKFTCVVGQNDAGKSTILRALDAFINDSGLSRADYNVYAQNNRIEIELFFDSQSGSHTLGEEIATTIENEELTNSDGLLQLKKVWSITETNVGKPKMYIMRKKYQGNNDFVFKTEAQLITQCNANNIQTTKGNGDEFNNVEKREKLREWNSTNNIQFSYEYEELVSTGTSKQKIMGDAIKKILPKFQYFKADTSLSDTDTTIQNFFKEMAFDLIETEIDTVNIEDTIRDRLGLVLGKITDKINHVVKSDERVQPKIDFDWSKLIKTSFVSSESGNDLPLSSRGDGFRRITMMAYFEHLAETQRVTDAQQIIFGFEEPETFLHPSAQDNLYDKLHSLSDNGYQVIVSTHSSTIVGNTIPDNLIHVSKHNNNYTISQGNIDYKGIALDLGIKPDTLFTPLFSTSRLLFLVEGISDVHAMAHNAEIYKANGLIPHTFDDLQIAVIPIGSCGAVKHWVNLDLFTKLEKPYHIFLDSDKSNAADTSKNEIDLIGYGLQLGTEFTISKKRLLENYMHPTALARIVPGVTVTFGDFDHAKDICTQYPDSGLRAALGGKHVAERHYQKLTFDELRLTWFDGVNDEFIELYNIIVAKLN